MAIIVTPPKRFVVTKSAAAGVFTNKPEATRRKAVYQILVNGEDVSPNFDPHLISIVTVRRSISSAFHTCEIELDDRDGSLAIPDSDLGNFGQIVVMLGWHTEGLYEIFRGTLTSVESGFGRKQGGRRLWLICSVNNLKGPTMTRGNDSFGAGVPPGKTEGEKVPLSQVIEGLAKKAGITMQIDEKFGGIKRDFWQQSGSFVHFMSSVAKEVGADFQMTSPTTGAFSAAFSNQTQPHLRAIWGDNLIGWRIRPFVSRGAYASTKNSFFSEQIGKWASASRAVTGNDPFSTATAINALPNPAPNAQVGDQRSWSAAAAGAVQQRGTGWLLINGEPGADVRMWLEVAGARPGVDGIYRVTEVEQDYSRHGGFTTRLTVDSPFPDATAATTPPSPPE